MATRTLYRYEKRYFKDGESMFPDGDHLTRLTPDQVSAEQALRAPDAGKAQMRSASLYAWDNEERAREAWRGKQNQYLYTLEVDEADIVFESDVNHFTDLMDALKDGRSSKEPVDRYWANDPYDPERHNKQRKEVLFSAGKVVRREKGMNINALSDLLAAEEASRNIA